MSLVSSVALFLRTKTRCRHMSNSTQPCQPDPPSPPVLNPTACYLASLTVTSHPIHHITSHHIPSYLVSCHHVRDLAATRPRPHHRTNLKDSSSEIATILHMMPVSRDLVSR